MSTINLKSLFTKLYPWIVWTLSATFFFYKYLVQVSPSVMTDDLMTAFSIHGAGLGNLSAFYFYAYLFMQIPVGIMLDKYSPRLLTTAAILICSLSTFLFAHANTLWLACLCRAFIGAGAAFAAVSCFKLAALWFSPKRFALVSGMFMTAAMLGAVGGQMPLAILVEHEGWRGALECVGGIGLVFGLIYYLVVRDKKTEKSHHESYTKQPATKRLYHIVTNRQAWVLSLYSGLAFAPVSVFGGLWGVPFLEIAYHLTRNDAAMAISCIFIGFAAGAPFWGWFSDYIQRRKPVLLIGTGSALLCLLIVVYSTNHSLTELSCFLFLFGFGSSGFFTSFAMIRELFSIALVATVLGIMNTFNSIFEALFEPLVGAVLDWTWDGAVVRGMHHFSLQGYHWSLSLLPGALLLALLCLFFIQETHCRIAES